MTDSEPISVSLEKSEDYPWETVYYYIVEYTRTTKDAMTVWGGGYTIKECKESALAAMNKSVKRGQLRAIEIVTRMIIDADPDSTFYGSYNTKGYTRKFGLYIGEAKVYIYGKRLGFRKLRVALDPYINRNFVRYAGVKLDRKQ